MFCPCSDNAEEGQNLVSFQNFKSFCSFPWVEIFVIESWISSSRVHFLICSPLHEWFHLDSCRPTNDVCSVSPAGWSSRSLNGVFEPESLQNILDPLSLCCNRLWVAAPRSPRDVLAALRRAVVFPATSIARAGVSCDAALAGVPRGLDVPSAVAIGVFFLLCGADYWQGHFLVAKHFLFPSLV